VRCGPDEEERVVKSDREEEKAAREICVFLVFAEFAEREGLSVRPGSVVSRHPPEPDVLCEVEGEWTVAFELVEIVDSALAENISVSIRKNVSADGTWVGDPTLERITTKVGRTYKTQHPIELVAWANLFTTPPSVWLPTFRPRLRALRGRSQFRRIWVVNLGGRRGEPGVWFVDPPLPPIPGL